ncbi:hypothetical protein CR64_09530, partial [Pseudomonas aeruginosa]
MVAPQAQPADPYAELQETLAAGKLEQAEQQWLALRSAAAGDERVEAFRRQLAEPTCSAGKPRCAKET